MTTYTSDDRRHTAETAASMTDVRYEIDRIDRLLVEIIAEPVLHGRRCAHQGRPEHRARPWPD